MNVAHAVRSNAAAGRPTATRPADVRADRWRVIAGELSRMTGVAEHLVEDHRADATGRCRVCSLEQAGSVAWPCTLHWLATEALRTRR